MARRPVIAWDTWLPAPAKLNLFLHVVGRRQDGYHLLQTVFRLIDWSDYLRFGRCGNASIRLLTPLAGVDDEANLAVRAARALRDAAKSRHGVTIEIDKRLPMGGGLGGGSSDAATTLIALNALWGLNLPRDALMRIGLGLGADVPVFVNGRNAFAEGIGELLQSIDLNPAWYVILTPDVTVPTALIFGDPTLTRNTERTTIAAFFAGERLANDLEPVVRRRYPEVARYLDWLAGFGVARMSGSGSCVFAEMPSESAARAVIAQLEPGMKGLVVGGLLRHPLVEL
jgi:4-diphosphocytidyl-2-C-methyl-D-erythritol kinase